MRWKKPAVDLERVAQDPPLWRGRIHKSGIAAYGQTPVEAVAAARRRHRWSERLARSKPVE